MNILQFVFKDRSLWYKFTLFSIIPVLFVCIFITFNIVTSLENNMIEDRKFRFNYLTRITAFYISNAYAIYNKNLLDNFVDSLGKEIDIKCAMIVDSIDNRILAHNNHRYDGEIFENSSCPPTSSDTGAQPQHAPASPRTALQLVSAPIVIEGKKYGDVKVGFSLEDVFLEIEKTKRRVFVVAGGATLLGCLLSLLLAGMVSRPIKRLEQQASGIGAGNLEGRIVYRSRDALGRLADSFNRMALGIRDRQEQLEAVNAVADTVNRSLDPQVVADRAMDALIQHTGAKGAVLHMIGEDGAALERVSVRPCRERDAQGEARLVVGSGLAGEAVALRRIVVDDGSVRPCGSHGVPAGEGSVAPPGLRVAVPLQSQDKVLGAVGLVYPPRGEMTRNEKESLLAMGKTIALAMTNARHVARIEEEIRQRKHAEESSRRYGFIVNTSRDWNTLVNVRYVYEAANDAYCTSLDRDRPQVIGHTVQDIWGEEVFRGAVKESLDRCFRGEEVSYQAWFDIPRLGTQCFQVTYYPYRDRENTVTHAVVVSHNITEHKRTEETLRQRVEEITALNALGESVSVSLSPDQVIKAALEGIAAPIGPDAAMLYLKQGDHLQLLGIRSPGEDASTHTHNVHRLGDCLCGVAAVQGKPLYAADIHTDSRCTQEEGRRAGMRSFAALPLHGAEGVIGLLGLASRARRDFSEQATFLETLASQVGVALDNALLHRQLLDHAVNLEHTVAERTAELRVAMEKAQEADRLKSAFLASMSHELRTPLNSIIGFTGILLQGMVGPLNDEQNKQLGIVRESARHLLNLINDVLDISKIEAGQLETASEPFPMREAVEKVVEAARPLAEKKGLSLTVHVAPDVDLITSDRRRVEQILINLVNNALKFTAKGRVSVECTVEGGLVTTRVTDTGIGIKQEDRDKLFNAFQQIETGLTRRYDGTGLGLSICKKLVEILGGTIWAESRWGVGSVFAFTLPEKRGQGP